MNKSSGLCELRASAVNVFFSLGFDSAVAGFSYENGFSSPVLYQLVHELLCGRYSDSFGCSFAVLRHGSSR
jgi:hypothetical protein